LIKHQEECKYIIIHGANKCLSPSKRSTYTSTPLAFVVRKEEDIHSLRIGTADLLDMLLEQERDTDFTFCLGSDTFIDLTDWKWKRSKDVLSLLQGRLMVIDRPNETTAGLQERIDQINERESANVRLLRVPTLSSVSSTMIRSCQDENKLQSLLSSAVLDFIKEQKMYSFADS